MLQFFFFFNFRPLTFLCSCHIATDEVCFNAEYCAISCLRSRNGVLPCSNVQHRCHVRHTQLYCTDEVVCWLYQTISSVMLLNNRHCTCSSNKSVVVDCTLKVANTRRYLQYNAFIYLYWHRATSRKVADSIVISQSHNPSGRTMALGLTQPLTEMSTRNIS